MSFIPLQYKNLSTLTVQELAPFLLWCVQQEATDITIQSNDYVFCHIHGKKHRVMNKKLRNAEVMAIITEIYQGDGALAILNSGQDLNKAWVIQENKKVFRFRVNMKAGQMENQKGYSLTLRVIKNNIPALETLDLQPEILNNIDHSKGLFIISSSVGTGKTTLIASIIAHRVSQPDAHLKIATYEYPIEFVFDDIPKPTSTICQSEINVHLNSFHAGLENSLRCATDAILVGEIREKNSIEAAILAAMTGTFVYSTAHSNGVSDGIRRLVNVFDAEERNAKIIDLLTTLKVFMSQMLIPSVDGKRIAIREYLIFTQEIVEILLSAPLDYLTINIKKLLKEKKSSFLDDLQKKYELGLISSEVYYKTKKGLE